MPGACLRESRRRAMTDNVIQSFCERCGARFTQPAPLERPAQPAGMLGRFLRRPADPEGAPADGVALPINEAFGDTFRFCLGCRRYNCQACWNEQEGHCLSCRPLEGQRSAEPDDAERSDVAWVGGVATGPRLTDEARDWPSGDLTHGGPDTVADAGAVPAVGGSVTNAPVADALSATTSPPVTDPPTDPAVGAVPNPAKATDLPWTPAPELDPWRGVVFSADDPGRSENPAVPVPTEDVGVLASLIDTETHVDASGWARASAAVMGRGGVSSGPPPDDAGSSTSDHTVEAVPDEVSAPPVPVERATSDPAVPSVPEVEPSGAMAEPSGRWRSPPCLWRSHRGRRPPTTSLRGPMTRRSLHYRRRKPGWTSRDEDSTTRPTSSTRRRRLSRSRWSPTPSTRRCRRF